MARKIKIYVLIDPRNNNIFYVGATTSPLKTRLTQHYSVGRSYKCGEIINRRRDLLDEIRESGFSPTIQMIAETTIDRADEYESKFYYLYKQLGYDMIQSEKGFTYSISQSEKVVSARTGKGRFSVVVHDDN